VKPKCNFRLSQEAQNRNMENSWAKRRRSSDKSICRPAADTEGNNSCYISRKAV
jgi:hypothetical protein